METRTLYVDSKNRDARLYPTGNAFTLHLTDQIKNVCQVDLVAAKIPNTLYNLTSNSTTLTVDINGLATNPMKFNKGFYSTFAIASEINLRLPVSANVTYVPAEGKFFIFSLAPFTMNIHSTELAKILGLSTGVNTSSPAFLDPVYSQDPAVTNGFFIKSLKVSDTSIDEFIFLDILELRTPGNMDALALNRDGTGTYTGMSSRNSFAMIQMDVQSGCIKSFKEETDYTMSVKFPHPIDKLSRLTINWLDSQAKPIDFQGLENNSFVLRIHVAVPEIEVPPVPNVLEAELKRIVDAMTAVAPPPEPEKKVIGRWTIWLIALLALLGFAAYKTWVKPNPGVALALTRAI
jgi:hypothetical protein